jgi:hypothetical protein
MRRAVWGVPVLVMSACSAGVQHVALAPLPVAVTQPSEIAAYWDVDRADAASYDVDLHFVAAACSVVQRIIVTESAQRVVITLDQAGRSGKDCTEPFVRHRRVHLASPIGGRLLYDGGLNPPLLRPKPA